MRTLTKNKEKLWYSLLLGEMPIYELDENGNKIVEYIKDGQNIYRETGEKLLIYTTPKQMNVSIAMSGSSADLREYGMSTSDYQATLLYEKGEYPLNVTALVWHRSDIVYRDGGNVTINGVSTKNPDPSSSDYTVIKTTPSLNMERAILKATNK